METAGKTQHKAWHGLKVTRHSEYSMQMIRMGETGMTAMGGVIGGAVKKRFALHQQSLFLYLHMIDYAILIKLSKKYITFRKAMGVINILNGIIDSLI